MIRELGDMGSARDAEKFGVIFAGVPVLSRAASTSAKPSFTGGYFSPSNAMTLSDSIPRSSTIFTATVRFSPASKGRETVP